jgi:hypothetical protein
VTPASVDHVRIFRLLTREPDERIGTIDADRAITAQRAYLGAFFDLHLRHHDNHLLSKPSPRYPEIEFVP